MSNERVDKCNTCGYEIPEGIRFCPACGAMRNSPRYSPQDQRKLNMLYGPPAVFRRMREERARTENEPKQNRCAVCGAGLAEGQQNCPCCGASAGRPDPEPDLQELQCLYGPPEALSGRDDGIDLISDEEISAFVDRILQSAEEARARGELPEPLRCRSCGKRYSSGNPFICPDCEDAIARETDEQ